MMGEKDDRYTWWGRRMIVIHDGEKDDSYTWCDEKKDIMRAVRDIREGNTEDCLSVCEKWKQFKRYEDEIWRWLLKEDEIPEG